MRTRYFIVKNYKLILLFALVFSASNLFGQEYDDPFTVAYDTPLTIDLEAEEEEMDDVIDTKKKKRVKKNFYYGLKTKKGFTRTGFGSKTVIEQFNYLKVYQPPDPYVRDIYWYSFKKKKIVKSRKFDRENGVILHGPYEKRLGEQVLEKGIFYVGTKHGRWVRLNKHDILQSKEKYYKGWPKESKVAYYDRDRKQIREVIPIQFGEKEGNYFAFHKSGKMAAAGEFHFDRKVGIWTEYYDARRRKKREIQYPKEPFDANFRPFIIREWDEKGTIIYDRERFIKQTSK